MRKAFVFRQVPPDEQDYPFDLWDFPGDEVILLKNHCYPEHTNTAFDVITDMFEDMAADWENDGTEVWYEDGAWHTAPKPHTMALAELLQDWGMWRRDGKQWTDDQLCAWESILDRWNGPDVLVGGLFALVPALLSLLTGREWKPLTIRGRAQGEWQDGFCIVEWDYERIHEFAAEYFGMVDEWILEGDEESAPLTEFFTYTSNPAAELAQQIEASVDSLTLYAFDGYTTTPKYVKL